MKKYILLLALLTICGKMVADLPTNGADAIKLMNPYTSQLSHEVSADGKSVTFYYYMNATATSIDIMIDVNGDSVFTEEEVAYTITEENKNGENGLTRKPNELQSITIPFTEFNEQIPRGKGYNWAMRANREAYTSPTAAYPRNWARYVYNIPQGLSIDNNTENDYFGYIYATESVTATVNNSKAGGTCENHTKNQGVYVLDAALDTVRYDGTNTCMTGGVSWNSESNEPEDDDEHAPYRTYVAENGFVYINDNRRKKYIKQTTPVSLWRFDPKKLRTSNTNFSEILKVSELKTPGGTYAQPRAICMAVMGKGENQKLYVMNAYQRETVDKNWQFYPRLSRYSLNNTVATHEKDWVMRQIPNSSEKGDLVYNGTTYTLANEHQTMIAGVHNDLWIAQRRAQWDGVPCLIHVRFDEDDKMICDYIMVGGKNAVNTNITHGVCPQAAIALSPDGSMLAFSTEGWIDILDITYDPATKTPTLVRNDTKSFQPSGSDVICNALAFDRANNLYALSQTTHQLYVYALPGQASTTIPAKKALTLDVPHVVCWHPYPENKPGEPKKYNTTNEDLWQVFRKDYNWWYMEKTEQITEARTQEHYNEVLTFTMPPGGEYPGGLVMDFLTKEESPWKWLGDYISEVAGANATLPEDMDTNEELWTKFMPYFNEYLNDSRAVQGINNVATFVESSDKAKKILTDDDSQYKWLGDYIIEVAAAQERTITQYWNYVLHGFFNAVKDGYVKNSQGTKIYYNIDFSEAGKPENWGPAYLKWKGEYYTLDTEQEWRYHLHAFFNCMNNANDVETADFSIAGQPTAWHDAWMEGYFPQVVYPDDRLPGVVRNDSVLAGWYYGADHTGSTYGYNLSTPVEGGIDRDGCVYARWLETCLYEGYVNKDEYMLDAAAAEKVNNNILLIQTLNATNESYALDIDRKLQGGMYNTMSLPFAIWGKKDFATISTIDAEGNQIATPFAQVDGTYPFSLVRYTGTTEATIGSETVYILQFEEVADEATGSGESFTGIHANVPFLIKPNEDITDRMQYGVKRAIITDGIDATTAYGKKVENDYFDYTSVLAPAQVAANSVILVADNRLAVTTGGEMKGLRGFFTKKEAVQSQAMMMLQTRPNAPTGLDYNMPAPPKVGKFLYQGQIYILRGDEVYTITGAKVK